MHLQENNGVMRAVLFGSMAPPPARCLLIELERNRPSTDTPRSNSEVNRRLRVKKSEINSVASDRIEGDAE